MYSCLRPTGGGSWQGAHAKVGVPDLVMHHDEQRPLGAAHARPAARGKEDRGRYIDMHGRHAGGQAETNATCVACEA